MKIILLIAYLISLFTFFVTATPALDKRGWSEYNDGQLLAPPLGLTVQHSSKLNIKYKIYTTP